MRFLVDENVGTAISAFLKERGHDVVVPVPGSADNVIASLARRERRIILTHDGDFANIVLYPPRGYSGIIRMRIHPPTDFLVLAALKGLLDLVARGELKLKGRLVVLEKNSIRIR